MIKDVSINSCPTNIKVLVAQTVCICVTDSTTKSHIMCEVQLLTTLSLSTHPNLSQIFWLFCFRYVFVLIFVLVLPFSNIKGDLDGQRKENNLLIAIKKSTARFDSSSLSWRVQITELQALHVAEWHVGSAFIRFSYWLSGLCTGSH